MTTMLAGSPTRFLTSWWPWRACAYLLTGWIVAIVWVTAVAALVAVPALGLAVLLAGVPLASVERWRQRLIDPVALPSAHRRLMRPGLWGWLATRFREAATWRELGYALLFSLGLAWLDAAVGLLVGSALFLVLFPALVWLVPQYQPDALLGFVPPRLPEAFLGTAVGLVTLPVLAYVVTAYAVVRAGWTRSLLLGSHDRSASAELVELTRSRARIMHAMDAQRRRIERDLHDGAQQRLTGLIMTLGMARLQLAGVPPAGRDLVETAYAQAREALTELRDLVHGIHPQVLTDRGLAPAVAEIAERCPVPVEVRIDLPERPPEPVEAAAWFVLNEALTNIAKHSGAARARIEVHGHPEVLVVDVHDDGVGGADATRGTGLLGLADRVAVLNGRITLSSPPGGPTILHVELPCA